MAGPRISRENVKSFKRSKKNKTKKSTLMQFLTLTSSIPLAYCQGLNRFNQGKKKIEFSSTLKVQEVRSLVVVVGYDLNLYFFTINSNFFHLKINANSGDKASFEFVFGESLHDS
mmetsp:Transcript_16808/g.18711  ORF Transcript_16808/g.18711 Transcript_16808/m.18711 type:complete len:115 (+) Transcript_16808:422-766(+)